MNRHTLTRALATAMFVSTPLVSIPLLSTAAMAADTSAIHSSDVRFLTGSPGVRPSDGPALDNVMKLFDGVLFTSWATTPGPDGAWVKLRFSGTRYVSRVDVVAGCAASNRTFAAYSRPRGLVLEGTSGTRTLALADHRSTQSFVLEPPLPVAELTVRFRDASRGRSEAICLSELRFHELSALGRVDERVRERIEVAARQLGSEPTAQAGIDALVAIGPAAVPRLSVVLANPHEAQSHGPVLAALRAIGSPRAAEAILGFVASPSWPRLLPDALRALSRTGDSRAIGVICEHLKNANDDIARAADESLQGFGSALLEPLSKLLAHGNATTRLRALEALRHASDPRLVSLVAPFVKDADAATRVAATLALGGSRGPEGLVVLGRLVTDPEPVVREAAGRALSAFALKSAAPHLAVLLRDADYVVARTALRAVSARPEGAPVLGEYLAGATAPLGLEAIQSLSERQSPGGLEVLVEALRRGETRFRVALRNAIATYGQTGLKALLELALTDEGLRRDAAHVLSAHAEAALPLLERVVDSGPQTVPLFVVQSLGHARHERALAVLDRVFEGSGRTTQAAVVLAWGRFPAPWVQDRVLRLLASPDESLRAHAARTAGRAQIAAAIPSLRRALDDGTLPRVTAITALGALRDESLEAVVVTGFSQATTSERFAILKACKRLETRACLNLLYGATYDRDPSVRSEAQKLIAGR